MSFVHQALFDDPGDFTFDSDVVEFVSGSAQLALTNVSSLAFNEPFDSDVGFTYDTALAEFAAGKVQQKSQVPAGATFGATYTNSINGSWGDGALTGTAVGGAAIASNRLDLTHEDVRHVNYSGIGNAQITQTGCIRLRVTPNYTGSPASLQTFIQLAKANNVSDNMVFIRHDTSGYLGVGVWSNTGSSIVFFSAPWSPVSGTTYEIELNFDVTTGASRLFVSGVQLGISTGTGIRDSNIELLRVGSNISGSATSNFSIEDLVIFNTVQHTANYTPGYAVPEYRYLASNVTLPEMEYTGAGNLISFDAFAATDTNTPKYTIQIARSGNYLFWNGSAWVVSNGTYIEANNAVDFTAHAAGLSVFGQIYGQFKIHFNTGAAQMSVADLTATLTAQTYSTDDPTITQQGNLHTDGLVSWSAEVVETGLDEVRYHFLIDRISMYWTGVEWGVSDQTFAQSNTSAEIVANLDTLDLSEGVEFQKVVVLHSETGVTTPSITSIELGYDVYYPPVVEPSVCIVYGYANDMLGAVDFTDATISATILRRLKLPTGHIILPTVVTTPIRVSGYFEIELVTTASVGGKVLFSATYNGVRKTLGIAIIPDEPSILLTDILV